MDRLKAYFLVVIFAIQTSGCSLAVTKESTNTDWELAEPNKNKFYVDKLKNLTANLIDGKFPNTHSVLIEHNGKLIYEEYFEGYDESYGIPRHMIQMNQDTLHDLRSVTKSVVSIMVGIALKEDFENQINTPITDYFSYESYGKEVDSVTLKHVLTMTAGLDWNEMDTPFSDLDNDERRLYEVDDPIEFVLGKNVITTPGVDWYYNGGLSQVLVGVVERLSGQPFLKYVEEKLFSPLGIDNYQWNSSDNWKHKMPAGAVALRLNPRDLAKIGSLYLNNGKWKGIQVVPEEWVNLSSKRHVESLTKGWDLKGIYGYGFHWRHGRFPQEAVTALGLGNQRIFVLPAQGLSVTIFAGEYHTWDIHSERILWDILGSLK